MATPVKTFDVPYKDKIQDKSGIVATSWSYFFRSIWERLYALGQEKSFVIVNNQVAAADLVGMVFSSKGVTQVVVDFLIQRVTTGASAVELIESGFFILTYRPTLAEWQITLIQTDTPDDSGVEFTITPIAFTATYDHTTGLWTKSGLALINGQSVTLAAATALPTGYTVATTYYVTSATSSTFKLSATAGGSAVTAATDNGTGTQTVTPTHAADGQVQYTSSNITGTASISSIFWRARTLGGKNSQFSSLGAR